MEAPRQSVSAARGNARPMERATKPRAMPSEGVTATESIMERAAKPRPMPSANESAPPVQQKTKKPTPGVKDDRFKTTNMVFYKK